MLSKIKTEPAVVVSALVAVVGAASTLGLIGTDTKEQLVAVITAVVPLIGGLIVRASVTPNVKAAALAATPTPAADPEPAEPQPSEEAPAGDDTTADVTDDTADVTDDTAADPAPADPAPAPAAPEDPVKASLKAAIETVRVQANAANDARAAAATAAVEASA